MDGHIRTTEHRDADTLVVGQRFRWKDRWYVYGNVGGRPMASNLEPNQPTGVPQRRGLAPPMSPIMVEVFLGITPEMRLLTKSLMAQLTSRHPPEISVKSDRPHTISPHQVKVGLEFTVSHGIGYTLRAEVEIVKFGDLEEGDRFCAKDDEDHMQWFICVCDQKYAPLAGAYPSSPFGSPLDQSLAPPHLLEAPVQRLAFRVLN